MKKTSSPTIVVLIAGLLLSTGAALHGAQIQGSITFAGTVTLGGGPMPISAGTATTVTGWHFTGTTGNP